MIQDDSGVTVLDRDTGQELGHLTREEIQRERGDGRSSVFVDDSVSMLFPSSGHWVLSQYSLPGLQRQARYILPTAVGDTETPGSDAATDEVDNSLVAVVAGVLSVWDTRTGTMVGEPVRLGSTPEEASWHQQNAGFARRPGHPNQIAIIAPNGSVELWDIEQRRLIRTIPTRIDPTKFDIGFYGNVLFDSTGNRLVYVGANSSTIEVWDTEAAKAARAPIPAPGVGSLLGFDSANHLVAEHESLGNIKFWDLEAGRESGSLRLASSLDYDATVEDGQRINVGGSFEVPYELPITAEQWFAHLCRTLNRDFTESERVLLPPGTDLNPPCSMNR